MATFNNFASTNNTATLGNNEASTSTFYYQDGEVISQTWHPAFVCFAFAIAFVSSYTAVHLLDHDIWRSEKEKEFAIIKWPRVVAAMILGVGTVWCMHFVGMAAVTLDHTPTCFEWSATMGSLAAAVIFMVIAVLVASTDVFATEDRVHVLKQVVLEKRNGMTRRSSRDRKRNQKRAMRELIYVICFQQLHPLMIAAVVAAAGAMIMHYTGMMALHGPFHKRWDIFMVMGSALIAVLTCFVGFWIIFRLRWKVKDLWPRVLSATIIAAAICGLHFFGMLGITYVADSQVEDLCLKTLAQSQESPNEWETHQIVVVGISILVPTIGFFVENIINQELMLTHGSKKDAEFARLIKRVQKTPPASVKSHDVSDDKVLESTFSCSPDTDDDVGEDLTVVAKELENRLEKNNSGISVSDDGAKGLSCDYATPDQSKPSEAKPEAHPDA